MTNKNQILDLVNRMDENASIDQVIYQLELLKNIQIGIDQLNRGEGISHDELFDELLRDDEEHQDQLVPVGKRKPQTNKVLHKPKRAKNGQSFHKTTKGVRKKA